MIDRLRKNIIHVVFLSSLLIVAGLICHLHDLRESYAGNQTTSGKTVDNLISISRDLLDVPAGESGSSAFHTDAKLQRYVNQALRDIIAKTHCMEEIESQVLDTGTSEYPISSNYVTVTGVLWEKETGVTNFKALKRESRLTIGQLSVDTDEPEFYYEYSGKIGIVPIDTTVSGTTIQVYYVPRQADLSSGSSPIPTPASLDPAIVFYVTSFAFAQDRRFGEAQYYMNLYRTEIQQFRQDFIYQKPETMEEAVQ
jgi:hypothetical protein